MSLLFGDGEREADCGEESIVQTADLSLTLDIATQLSAYSAVETLRAGTSRYRGIPDRRLRIRRGEGRGSLQH